MSVVSPIVLTWDGLNRRIYLKSGVSDYFPIEDIYHEYRNVRRLDENLRAFEPLLKAEGNTKKGGGAFTPRYVVLLNGTKIVPFNETLQINQLGDMITDDPDADATLYDISGLTVAKPIFIKPSESEIIQLNSLSIEYSSYGGGVTIDVVNGESGTDGGTGTPIGTALRPSNNEEDAHFIASRNGFKKIFIRGSINLTDQTVSWENFEFVGESPLKTQITIDTLATVSNCEFYDASVTGILDGNSHIERSVISNLFFVDGYIYNCAIGPATITLGTSTVSNMFECYSTVPGSLTPIVDMNGTGQLALRGYKGGILLKNYNGTGEHSIDLSSGQIKFDDTITSGTFIVRGVGKLVDTNGNHIHSGTWNGGVTIVNELVNNEEIKKVVWEAALSDYPTQGTAGYVLDKTKYLKRSVYVDPELITNGDGSSGNPFNNIGDTIDFAEAHNLREITALTEITIDRNLKNFIITGIGTPVINCGGFVLKGSEFRHCTMRGLYVDSIIVQESVLDNGFYLNGFFENCAAKGTLICVDGGNVLLKDCAGLTVVTISMNGIGSSILKISNQTGELIITDCNNVSDDLNIGITEGKLTLDSTCDNGNIDVYGSAFYTNNSTGATVNSDALVDNLIWNKTLP